MITKGELKWLFHAFAFGAGELLASTCPNGVESWGYFALAAFWVFLVGLGFAIRGWTFPFFLLAGLAVFFFATRVEARHLRENPWLRGARARVERRESSPLKRDFSRRVALGLDHARETVVLNRAILLGERAFIPRATREAFVNSGTIHVFAISGLHVMIVAKVLLVIVAFTFLPWRAQGLAALVPVWGYVLLIGVPPSALRAALMASVCFLAPLVNRRANGLMAWVVAFFVSHLLFPKLIVNVGSQLSYLVMLGLILSGRFFKGHVALTCAAWAAGVPVAAMVFGRVTPGGILANLVLIAAASYSVGAGALGILLSFVSTTVAVHFNNLAALMTEAMVFISETVARLPGANVDVPPWSLLMCLEWYAAFALVLYLVHLHRLRQRCL